MYSERLTVNLRNTGLFDAVRPLDSIPRPDLIARVTRPIYGNAVIPIFTAISLGLVPTISDEEWGDAFVLIRTADTTKQVPVEFSYHGPTTLGWLAVIQNLRRDPTSDDPYTSARFRGWPSVANSAKEEGSAVRLTRSMLLGLCVLAHATTGCFRSERECPPDGCQNNVRGEQADAKGPWATKAAMPEPAALMPASVVSGILYVFGSMPNLSLLVYDPVSDSWTKKAALPTKRDFAATAVVNGILYVVGGRGLNADFTLQAFSTVEAYDPVTNTWTTKAAMPTPRFGAASGVVNGIVYVVGGFGASGTRLSTVEAYNPATNMWSAKRAMPSSRSSAAAGAINAILYVLGGEGAKGVSILETLEAYDPISDTWVRKAPMPTPRSTPVIGVVDGLLYVAGGGGSSNPPFFATLEAYNPATNSWTTRSPMPTPRLFAVGGVVNGLLYVAGGLGYHAWVTTLEVYNPALDTLGESRHQPARAAPAKYLP